MNKYTMGSCLSTICIWKSDFILSLRDSKNANSTATPIIVAVYRTNSTEIENTTGSPSKSPDLNWLPYISCLERRKIRPMPTEGPSASSTRECIGISLLLVGSAKTSDVIVAALMTEITETKKM